MRILHGSWLTASPFGVENDKADRAFALWAETSDTHDHVTKHKHPFAAPTRDLQSVLRDLFLDGLNAHPSTVTLLLPSTRIAPQPSPEIMRDEETTRGTLRITLAQWHVDALTFAPQDTLDMLAGLPSQDETPPGIKIGHDLRYWQVVAKFALGLLARQRLKPIMQKQDEKFIARWQPLLDEPSEQEQMTRLVRAMPPICRAVFRDGKDAKRNAPSPRDLLDDFLATTLDAFARANVDWGRYLPDAHKSIAEAWLDVLWGDNSIVDGSTASLNAFYEQYRAWAEPIGAAGGDTVAIADPYTRQVHHTGPRAGFINRRSFL